jgi:AbrB family looped-hinge helix DNA binding protein
LGVADTQIGTLSRSADLSSPLCLNLGKIFLRVMKSQDVPELTRISSKGQVVIPSRVREKLGIEAGSVFAILTPRKGNVVVLKKIDSKSLQADLRIFREIERAWREIERGQARRAPRKRFLEELETW